MTGTSFSGWFAKDPNVLRRVGHVLLQVPFTVQRTPRQMILADDSFQLLKIPTDRISQVVIKATEKLYGSKLFYLSFWGEITWCVILHLTISQ